MDHLDVGTLRRLRRDVTVVTAAATADQTFRLSWESMDEPIQRFRRALSGARIALSNVGETFVLPSAPPLDQPSRRPVETALVGG